MKFIMHRFGARFLISILIISFFSIDHVSFIDCRPLSRDKRAFSYIANETACTVDNIIYKDGDPIPTDDPCETCRCRPPGFTCILRHCEVKSGCRAIRRIGECCPSYQCGCEHNGQYFKDGDRIHNAESPCYSCYCQGSSITCSLADCQFRFDCEPEYVVGECCPRYDHCPSPPPSATSVKISSPTRRTSAATNSSMFINNETVAALFAKDQESVEIFPESLNTEISSIAPGIQDQVTTSSSLILDDETPFQLRILSPQPNNNTKESRQQEIKVPLTITTVATVQSEKTKTKSGSVPNLQAVPQTTVAPSSTVQSEKTTTKSGTVPNLQAVPQTTVAPSSTAQSERTTTISGSVPNLQAFPQTTVALSSTAQSEKTTTKSGTVPNLQAVPQTTVAPSSTAQSEKTTIKSGTVPNLQAFPQTTVAPDLTVLSEKITTISGSVPNSQTVPPTTVAPSSTAQSEKTTTKSGTVPNLQAVPQTTVALSSTAQSEKTTTISGSVPNLQAVPQTTVAPSSTAQSEKTTTISGSVPNLQGVPQTTVAPDLTVLSEKITTKSGSVPNLQTVPPTTVASDLTVLLEETTTISGSVPNLQGAPQTTISPDLTVESEKTTTESEFVPDLQDVPLTTNEIPIPKTTIQEIGANENDPTSVDVTNITEISLSSMMKTNDTKDEKLVESNSTTKSEIIWNIQTDTSMFPEINHKKLYDSAVATTQNPFKDFANTTPSSLDLNAEKIYNYFITTEESLKQEDDPEAEKKETPSADNSETEDTAESANKDDDRKPVTETSEDSLETRSTESIIGLVETTTADNREEEEKEDP